MQNKTYDYRNRILANNCFLQYFPCENLVSGAPDVPISMQKLEQKVTWKRARNEKHILSSRCPKNFQTGVPNSSPKSVKVRFQTPICPSCCSHSLPGCPRGPKMVPQRANMQGPGLANHVFGHQDWQRFCFRYTNALRTNCREPASQHTFQQRNLMEQKPISKKHQRRQSSNRSQPKLKKQCERLIARQQQMQQKSHGK